MRVLVPSTGNLYIYSNMSPNFIFVLVLVPSTGNLYIYGKNNENKKLFKRSRPLHGESIYLLRMKIL